MQRTKSKILRFILLLCVLMFSYWREEWQSGWTPTSVVRTTHLQLSTETNQCALVFTMNRSLLHNCYSLSSNLKFYPTHNSLNWNCIPFILLPVCGNYKVLHQPQVVFCFLKSKSPFMKFTITTLYHVHSIKCPGWLFNFWTLRVAAYSSWLFIQGKALIRFWPFPANSTHSSSSLSMPMSLTEYIFFTLNHQASCIYFIVQKHHIWHFYPSSTQEVCHHGPG